MDITNLTIGLGDVAAPADGGPTGAGVTVAILDSGVAVEADLGDEPHRRLEGLRQGQEAAVRRRRPRHLRRRAHRRRRQRLAAARGRRLGDDAVPRRRPGARTSSAIKVLDEFGQGRVLDRDRRHRLGDRPQGRVRHPRAQHLDRRQPRRARRPRTRSRGPSEAAWRHGIVVVCAAGNEGEFGLGGVLSPGNDPLRHHRRRD